MKAFMNSTGLANLSLLGNFIGMLTDSRSFLSYSRHEYFLRILCSLIGSWMENEEYPNDPDRLKQLIADICCHNVLQYFRTTIFQTHSKIKFYKKGEKNYADANGISLVW